MADLTPGNSPSRSSGKYDVVLFCSNRLLGVEQIFSINGINLLEIDKGDVPAITLTSPALPEKPNGDVLIRSNVSYVKDLSVWVDRSRKKTSVSFLGNVVLEALEIGESEVEIIELDLRGLGLNIWGSKSGLYIGNNSYIGNTMQGVGIAFGVGTQR